MISDIQHFLFIQQFTLTYKKHLTCDVATRELACLRVQYPLMLAVPQEGDLFAGRLWYPAVHFTPQAQVNNGHGFGYVADPKQFDALLNSPDLSQAERVELADIATFWETEVCSYKTRAAYPPDMAQALPSDAWTTESGVAFPLYRMGGSQLDFDKLLTLGISGLRQLIRKKAEQKGDDTEAQQFFAASLGALELFSASCRHLAVAADYLAAETPDSRWKDDLLAMKQSLLWVANEKPRTLHQAMQLFFLYNSMSGTLSHGRMDECFGDFLADDIASGRLNEDEALRLVMGLWRMMLARRTVFDGRGIIGGHGRRNPDNADRFAMLALEASRQVNDVLPQLNLRIHTGMNPALWDKALEVVGQGVTFPMLNNDDVNIQAVASAFDVTENEAVHYTPYGCGEYILYHRSFGTPSGVINLLKALEIALNNGVDPLTGVQMGPRTGLVHDFDTFDKLWEAYRTQIEYAVEQLARQEALEYRIAGDNAAFVYMSMLYDDCVERGRAIFRGGIRYLGGTLETYGNTNTADSLGAIKRAVYDDRLFTLDALRTMLLNDFEGFEAERLTLLAAPKYGNDDREADAMLQRVHNHVCHFTRDQAKLVGLHNYLVVVINNHANTILGRTTLASADGRRAFAPMANANNPSGGMDKRGITAMLNSLVKADIRFHAGAVQNLKLSKDMFVNHRKEIEALLRAYFSNGGAQAMITVVSRGDLENALREPEKYGNLIVRVGGFSARFIELDPDVQQEVLSRTLY